ncbi:MAG: bifunctional oligoribonuclease/PAP phosphatase NrnA [Flavobacteriales bacterium]|jgi:phosphoesterase RecJ-like protein|nr:bifunctional oligoribonuclease/PAP phosphatase NrnA [Flavobacteriales bacterium]
MQEKISKLKELLQNSQKIVITVHRGPDGDALGSALALQNILLQLNHEATVISPNNYASFLHWMKGNENVVIFTEENEKAIQITNDADLIFLLDFNNLSRIGEYTDTVKNASAKRIMIDHHQEPDMDAADIIISDTLSCSTSQLLFEVLEGLEYKHLINKDVAECIYTGIMTDTGSFKYSSTTDKTHHIIAELITKGADNSKIHDLIYDNYSEDRIKLLGYCINDKLLLYPHLKSAIISLNEQELEKFNFKKGDTEGVVNYALSVHGIIFAVFIAEKEGKVKMSFRSKGDFHVNNIAKKYFNGGGHTNAAGGISVYNIQDTIKKLEEIFIEYKNELLINN